jgi:organic radical activating enzyme
MNYSVKEIYYTLQGEGLHAGRPAVFLRFTSCNLWSGRDQDRQTEGAPAGAPRGATPTSSALMDREESTAAALQYCLAHPQCRLSLQTHKLVGIR